MESFFFKAQERVPEFGVLLSILQVLDQISRQDVLLRRRKRPLLAVLLQHLSNDDLDLLQIRMLAVVLELLIDVFVLGILLVKNLDDGELLLGL